MEIAAIHLPSMTFLSQPPDTLRTTVMRWLEENVPPPRLRHILSVEGYARELAEHYGLDRDRAAWAGFLHDLAKYVSDEDLLSAMSLEPEFEPDPVVLSNPHLLHADVGAIFARDRFDIDDPECLDAIRNHTLGRPGMSDLSCIVFLADALEPYRGNTDTLKRLRHRARTHLYDAVVQVCDRSLSYLMSKNKPIHPRAVATRNWFLTHRDRSPLPVIQETATC
ncbi:MAG: bis(5'-nucleosyl)-tetraphosphatase (symmetrical) YqeK [Cyanobacteria bacterium J06639_1]